MPESALVKSRRILIPAVFGIALLAGFLIWSRFGWSGLLGPVTCASPEEQRFASDIQGSYATAFPLGENPVSEGGRWMGGRSVGLDWTDVRTTVGLAFGTQSGTGQGRLVYTDSMAFLSGRWGADQSAQAAVRSVNQTDNVYAEVELLLRGTLSKRCVNAYEINFRCSKTENAYAEIVRWNGRLGDFTYLGRATGSQYGVSDGDVVRATAIGNVITSYINGREVLRVTDNTHAGGSPGMGFFLHGSGSGNSDCGFTSFAASNRSTPDVSGP